MPTCGSTKRQRAHSGIVVGERLHMPRLCACQCPAIRVGASRRIRAGSRATLALVPSSGIVCQRRCEKAVLVRGPEGGGARSPLAVAGGLIAIGKGPGNPDPDSRFGRNRESGNPRFPIRPGPGIGVPIPRAGDFLVCPGSRSFGPVASELPLAVARMGLSPGAHGPPVKSGLLARGSRHRDPNLAARLSPLWNSGNSGITVPQCS